MKVSYALIQKILLIVLFFVGISAVGGGIDLVVQDGVDYGLQDEWLVGSPFTNYFWPGVILTLVVGGTHFAAAIMLMKKHKYALEVGFVAGFGAIIWMFTEQYILQHSHYLQIIYFYLGIAVLLSTIALKSYVKK